MIKKTWKFFAKMYAVFAFIYSGIKDTIHNLIGNIESPVSSENVVNKDYLVIETQFRDAGFMNIELSILDDIENNPANDGKVEVVTIDGNSEFHHEYFNPDAKIRIFYYPVEEKINP